MRLSIKLDQVYGDYRIDCYSILVRRADETVWIELFNNDTHHMQKGGKLMVPTTVAKQIGEALIKMSAVSPDRLPMELKFTFDESQSDLTSPDPPSS